MATYNEGTTECPECRGHRTGAEEHCRVSVWRPTAMPSTLSASDDAALFRRLLHRVGAGAALVLGNDAQRNGRGRQSWRMPHGDHPDAGRSARIDAIALVSNARHCRLRNVRLPRCQRRREGRDDQMACSDGRSLIGGRWKQLPSQCGKDESDIRASSYPTYNLIRLPRRTMSRSEVKKRGMAISCEVERAPPNTNPRSASPRKYSSKKRAMA